MDFQEISQLIIVAVSALAGCFVAVRSAIKVAGRVIPGDDAFERADRVLAAKVDPVMQKLTEQMAKLEDLVRADTHGGVGRGPDGG